MFKRSRLHFQIQIRFKSALNAQVGSAVAEEEMIAAFREFGPISGWKFLRRSNCAFIDFETGAGAAAAREALHGAAFSG